MKIISPTETSFNAYVPKHIQTSYMVFIGFHWFPLVFIGVYWCLLVFSFYCFPMLFKLVDHDVPHCSSIERVMKWAFSQPISSTRPRSEDTSIRDKAKLALNAILQNIQAPCRAGWPGGSLGMLGRLSRTRWTTSKYICYAYTIIYIYIHVCVYIYIYTYIHNHNSILTYLDGKHLVGPFSFLFNHHETTEWCQYMSFQWTFAAPPTDKSIPIQIILGQNQAFNRVLTHSHSPKEYLTCSLKRWKHLVLHEELSCQLGFDQGSQKECLINRIQGQNQTWQVFGIWWCVLILNLDPYAHHIVVSFY